jgi:hypothetical protein
VAVAGGEEDEVVVARGNFQRPPRLMRRATSPSVSMICRVVDLVAAPSTVAAPSWTESVAMTRSGSARERDL